MPDTPRLLVTLSYQLEHEASVTIAADALRRAARLRGWELADGQTDANRIIRVTLEEGTLPCEVVPGTLPTVEEQSHEISSDEQPGSVVTTVVGGGALGASYGLSWLRDRILTHAPWPPANEKRAPAFQQRFTFAWSKFVESDEPPYLDLEASRKRLQSQIAELDNALLVGATAVLVGAYQYLMPFDGPTEKPWDRERHELRSAAARELFGELLRAAHARRLRIYARSDEFLYPPAWLEATGARLSTDDPKLWDALKSKYRGLLRELPELDGIATRTGEVLPHGDWLAWDVIHTDDDRSIEGNYRRYVNAMHDVVVGEFGKQFFHRIWVVNTWEQSSVPEIYARTFNDDVPMRNLILSIKLTTGDQWEWQPINPVFGQSPHATCAQVESARAQDYFSGPPDFAVEFVQAGLEWALERGAVAFATAWTDVFQDRLVSGMEYVAWRLAWDPYQPVPRLCEEWLNATLDPAVSDRVARLLLDTDDIYREGFHIRGPSYHTWEPLVHVRTGWIAKGTPWLDGGYGQHAFLRGQYLQAKPELEHGIGLMDEYTRRFSAWLQEYRGWIKELPDESKGTWLLLILERGERALWMNRAYVRAFLRYFDYEDNSDEDHRRLATLAVEELERQLKDFESVSYEGVPGVGQYLGFHSTNTQGIRVFLDFARKGLRDLAALRADFAEGLDDAGVRALLARSQAENRRTVETQPDAPLVLRWRGNIDGREILRVNFAERTSSMEHCYGDGPSQRECRIEPLPGAPGAVAVKYTRGEERGWAHVLEQATKENGYTLTVLLEDRRPGQGAHDIGFYWVEA